ncbi:MAG TPA: hypothetical protein VEH84_14580, partial [Alphaproteobacteria bacterium]|nr:hypothetical protein [Alphaproteobacteria bacterium]
PLALGFAALLLLLAGAARLRPALPRPRLGLALLGLAAGIAITPLAHKAATGEAFLNRAGNVFLLGRWVQDGLAAAHLRRACPEAGYKLCPHAETLPATANDLLWDRRSPLWQLGGWEAFDEEAARIVRRSLMEDPIGNLAAAGRNWLIQLPMFETGDGLVPQVETTQRVIGERYPAEAAAYDSARQQRKPGLDFEPLNLYQVPLGWLALAANAAAALGLWRTAPRLRGLALLALAGVLGNAAVCAILSNPDDRYQNRMVWVALAAAALIAMARTRRAG